MNGFTLPTAKGVHFTIYVCIENIKKSFFIKSLSVCLKQNNSELLFILMIWENPLYATPFAVNGVHFWTLKSHINSQDSDPKRHCKTTCIYPVGLFCEIPPQEQEKCPVWWMLKHRLHSDTLLAVPRSLARLQKSRDWTVQGFLSTPLQPVFGSLVQKGESVTFHLCSREWIIHVLLCNGCLCHLAASCCVTGSVVVWMQ